MNKQEALELSLKEFDVWPYKEDEVMVYSNTFEEFSYIDGNLSLDYYHLKELWFVVAGKREWVKAKEATKSTEKWTPQNGEECEYLDAWDHNPNLDEWAWCEYIETEIDGSHVVENNMREIVRLPKGNKFRKIESDKNQSEKWTPKVGDECEAKENKPHLLKFADWSYFILIAINVGGNGKLQYVMRDSDGDIAILYEEGDIEFRPYKTQEDIEREEGIEALRKLLSKGVGDCEPDKYLATVIWDEGYRKV